MEIAFRAVGWSSSIQQSAVLELALLEAEPVKLDSLILKLLTAYYCRSESGLAHQSNP